MTNSTIVVGIDVDSDTNRDFLLANLRGDGFILNTERPEDADVRVLITQRGGTLAPITVSAGHTEHEMRVPFGYSDLRFVVRQLAAWGDLCDGDPCPECHAPGTIHKGHVVCNTRACPGYGDSIRPLDAGEVQGAMA